MPTKTARLSPEKSSRLVPHQGSYNLRTQIYAYAPSRHRLLEHATEEYDVDIVWVDNLNRMVGAAEAEPVRAKSDVNHAAGDNFCDYVIFIDHRLHDADKATLSGLVMNNAPLVVGPKAADDFTWHLKAEANAWGRIFEVAESNAALTKLIGSSLQAVRRRVARWKHHAPATTSPAAESDPLASLPGVMEVTHSLRSERGRLDAEKVRELFKFTRADLARITGVQEETIRQTPDSERLQRALQGFDRVARMLVLNPDRSKFATWLNTANDELDQRTPLELIKEGRIDVIGTLVHDIITNRGR